MFPSFLSIKKITGGFLFLPFLNILKNYLFKLLPLDSFFNLPGNPSAGRHRLVKDIAGIRRALGIKIGTCHNSG